MDAVKIYEEAARKVGRGEINLKEFWKLIKPLRDVEAVVRCAVCTHFQCNMCGDGTLPKGVEEFECRNGRGGCDPMGFCDEGEPKDDDGNGRSGNL